MTEDKSQLFFSRVIFIFSPWHWAQTRLRLLDLLWAVGCCSSAHDSVNLPSVSHHQHSLTYSSRVPNKAHTKRRGLVGLTHYLPAWFFCTQVRYSCTSSGDPRMRGTRWWMASGFTSSTGWVPVVAVLLPARWCRPRDCTHTGAGAEEKQSQVDKCSKLPRSPNHAPEASGGIPTA